MAALFTTSAVGQKRHFEGDKGECGSERDLECKRVNFLGKTNYKHTLTAEASA